MPTKVCVLCGKEFYTKSYKRIMCYDEHYHPCPICNKQVLTTGTSQNRLNQCCCVKHSKMLAARTMKDRYSTWPASTELAKERRRQTLLDRYGVTSAAKMQASKDKTKATIKKKYGVASGSLWSVPEIREKRRQTFMEHYGVDHPMKHPVIKMKNSLNRKMTRFHNISPKICKLCGKEFKPTNISQAYCNDAHYSKCEICGKEFELNSKYSKSRTCSKECRYALSMRTRLDGHDVDNSAKA